MVKIPGWAFLGVGALIFGVSTVLNKNENGALTLFIYVSYLFFAYGLGKIIVNYILKKGKGEDDPGSVPIVPGMPGNNIGAPGQVGLYGYIGYCSSCGTPMRKINNYCHRCGRKQILS